VDAPRGESLEMKQGASGMQENFCRNQALGLFLVGVAGLYRDLAHKVNPDPQLAFTATLDKEIRDFSKAEVDRVMWPITYSPSPGRLSAR